MSRAGWEPDVVPIDSVQVIDELYPRLRVDWDKVHEYGEILDRLPGIIVARGGVLVDGFHRLEAHKRAGCTEIKAHDLGDLSDDEILAESIRWNVKHGNALSRNDRQALALRLWPALDGDDPAKVKHLAQLLAVSERTVERWAEPLREAQRKETEAQRKAEEAERQRKIARAVELAAAGWTQRAIAGELGVKQQRVSEWLTEARQMSEPGNAAEPEPDPDVAPDPEPEPIDDETAAYLAEWAEDGDLIAAVEAGVVTVADAVATAEAREELAAQDDDDFTPKSPASLALAAAIRLLSNFLHVPDDGLSSSDVNNWRVMRALIPEVNQRIEQWKEAADDHLA